MEKEVSGSWNEGEIPLHTYQNGYSYTDVIGTGPMTDRDHQEPGGGGCRKLADLGPAGRKEKWQTHIWK